MQSEISPPEVFISVEVFITGDQGNECAGCEQVAFGL